MSIRPGCDEYQFRRFHQIIVPTKRNKTSYGPELYCVLEPVRQRISSTFVLDFLRLELGTAGCLHSNVPRVVHSSDLTDLPHHPSLI